MTTLTKTFRLFTRPSFLEGVGRLVDFDNSLSVYNDSKTPKEADFKAIRSDWESVGWDIQESLDMYGREK